MDNVLTGIKYFFIDLAADLVRWPIWWYTKGTKLAARSAARAFQNYRATLAVGIWVKNLFVPMFGQRDWQSRIISFFMRLFQILGRSFLLFVWGSLIFVLFVLYVLLPLVSFAFFVFHLLGFAA